MLSERRRSSADGRRKRVSRLRWAFVALVLAAAAALGTLAVAAAAGGSTAGAGFAGGTTVGILLDGSPSPEDVESGRFQSNDSYLGILVEPASGAYAAVAFKSQGAVWDEASCAYGSPVDDPGIPAWDWRLDAGGLVEGSDAPPAFGGWCVDEACTTAWDFSSPVTGPLVLWAAWDVGDAVEVTLHGEGALAGGAGGGPAGAVEGAKITRHEGSTYRSLPVPELEGRTFLGWWTADEAGGWGREVTATDAVDPAVRDLYARWEANAYRVVFCNNDDMDGWGGKYELAVVYGNERETVGGVERDAAFPTWDEARAAAAAAGVAFAEPYGKRFNGWCDKPDGKGGDWHRPGDPIDRLTSVPDGRVAMYAQWADAGDVEAGPFTVTYCYDDGATENTVLTNVEKGSLLAEPDPAPKRAGYQFAGWHADGATGRQWDFAADHVLRDLELHAAWDLRLDVTVPVSVGFAVDADTGEATGPDEDRYALKSRTVAPVVVEKAALESRQDELEGFFELKGAAASGADAGEGAADEVGGEGGRAAWAAALADTRLSLGAGGETVSLPFAGTPATDEDGAAVWDSAHPLTDTERAAFRMGAFAYGGTSADDEWQGGVPCEELPLKLGLTVPVDELKVRTDLDGPQKVTRLVLTVLAEA